MLFKTSLFPFLPKELKMTKQKNGKKIVVNFIFVVGRLDILFLSNHNIHKSSCDLSFWALDPLIDRF